MKTSRRISFEWALIRGQTDSDQTAHELGQLLKGLLCHVNVIPLNPTGGFGGKPTSKSGVDTFCEILGEYGISATPRQRRGIDIDAGCGQLATELQDRQRKVGAGVVGGLGGEKASESESEEVGLEGIESMEIPPLVSDKDNMAERELLYEEMEK